MRFIIGSLLFSAAIVAGGYMYGGSLAHPNVGGMFIGAAIAFANRVWARIEDNF